MIATFMGTSRRFRKPGIILNIKQLWGKQLSAGFNLSKIRTENRAFRHARPCAGHPRLSLLG
jgi:hypothetical protein